MKSFTLGKMTLKSLFSKPETTCYPFEQKTPPAGLKGHIDNDIKACILCGQCVKACPADALRVEKKEGQWIINRFKCVQCGSCTRVCPVQSLTMLPTYQTPAAQKAETIYAKPEETEEERALKAQKEAEKAERIRKAKAAKAARDAKKAAGEVKA